jgi:acetamidase/formamidase
MALHDLGWEPSRFKGCFSSAHEPVLSIASGDTLRAPTAMSRWRAHEQPARFEMGEELPRPTADDRGHACVGPVAISGATPGNMVRIETRKLVTADWGWVCAGGWDSPFNVAAGIEEPPILEQVWQIEAGIARNAPGLQIPIRPFLGLIGLMPGQRGVHSTRPPRAVGGNIDCRELVAGSALYVPVQVEGAMLYFGDGHAVQGDGEVSGVALECGMKEVELSVSLADSPLETAWAETPAGWVTLAFNADLNVATHEALAAMLSLMSSKLNISRKEAMALFSLAGDLRITQIVNEVRGVHAVFKPLP